MNFKAIKKNFLTLGHDRDPVFLIDSYKVFPNGSDEEELYKVGQEYNGMCTITYQDYFTFLYSSKIKKGYHTFGYDAGHEINIVAGLVIFTESMAGVIKNTPVIQHLKGIPGFYPNGETTIVTLNDEGMPIGAVEKYIRNPANNGGFGEAVRARPRRRAEPGIMAPRANDVLAAIHVDPLPIPVNPEVEVIMENPVIERRNEVAAYFRAAQALNDAGIDNPGEVMRFLQPQEALRPAAVNNDYINPWGRIDARQYRAVPAQEQQAAVAALPIQN